MRTLNLKAATTLNNFMIRVLHGFTLVLLLAWYGQALSAATSPPSVSDAVSSEPSGISTSSTVPHGPTENRISNEAFVDADDEPSIKQGSTHADGWHLPRRLTLVNFAAPHPSRVAATFLNLTPVYLLTDRFRL